MKSYIILRNYRNALIINEILEIIKIYIGKGKIKHLKIINEVIGTSFMLFETKLLCRLY